MSARVLAANIAHCRNDSPEYVSEASPVRLEMTRKLLATALERSGRADQGCRVLYAMHHDELGFWGTGAA